MSLIYKTLIPIVIVLGCASIASGIFLRSSMQNTLLKEQFLRMSELIIREAPDHLSPSSFIGGGAQFQSAQMALFVDSIKDTTVARVTIWDTNSRIVYSDLTSIIGIESPSHPHLEQVLQTGKALYLRKEFDDNYPQQSSINDFIDMYVPLHINGTLVGIVEVHSVAGAVLGPLSKELNIVVYVLLLSTLLVLCIVGGIFHFLVLTPIRQAGSLARSVSAGNFEGHTIPVYGDEIGDLVTNLNTMRERLKSLVENLESQVQARTRKLQEEETRLAASLGSLSVGLTLLEPSGKTFYVNDALRTILNYSPNETVGLEGLSTTFNGVIDVRDYFRRAIEKSEPFDESNIQIGQKIVRMFIGPVIMQREVKEILGVVILIDDITEAKILERAKEEFLAIASHELRTPLTAIRANASLLKQLITKRTKKAELGEAIDDIHTASIRLIKIVHDFLDISALEQRAIPFTTKSLDMVSCVRGVVEQLKGLAHEKGIALTIHEPPAPLPRIAADPERLSQVITNIIGNAIHYTSEGAIDLTFSSSEDTVTLLVRDSGEGIAPENQKLLFRKFQQAGSGIMTRNSSQGTGLGLYISKLILELMHGRIQLVESTPKRGSVFSIILPTSP